MGNPWEITSIFWVHVVSAVFANAAYMIPRLVDESIVAATLVGCLVGLQRLGGCIRALHATSKKLNWVDLRILIARSCWT